MSDLGEASAQRVEELDTEPDVVIFLPLVVSKEAVHFKVLLVGDLGVGEVCIHSHSIHNCLSELLFGRSQHF